MIKRISVRVLVVLALGAVASGTVRAHEGEEPQDPWDRVPVVRAVRNDSFLLAGGLILFAAGGTARRHRRKRAVSR